MAGGTSQEAIEDAMNAASSLAEDYVINPLEETICELMLSAGDFFVDILNKVIGREITITALVYNDIDEVNPNFFNKTLSPSGFTADIKFAVSEWYGILSMIATTLYLVALLATGFRILLASTGIDYQKSKEKLVEWGKAVIIFGCMPYVMKMAFSLNENIVELLKNNSNAYYGSYGGVFGDTDEWVPETIEYRSPEYVSRYTGQVEYGSDEASNAYLNKVTQYEQQLDLMRVMRAYAGVTKKFVYAVIWWILIGQLLAFIVMYYKRYFVIAFLIVMFPVVGMFQAISVSQGVLKIGAIGTWMREFFTNVFMQTIQAIVYTIITSVCISTIQVSMTSTAMMNWLLIILAINFVAEGEKILRKFLGAVGNTADTLGQSAKGVKGAINNAKNTVKKAFGG